MAEIDGKDVESSAEDSLIPGLDEAQGYSEPTDDDILEDAQARLALAIEAEEEIRKEALDDLTFIKGDQWPLDIKNQRNIEARPCLVINRLPQFVQQVTNDQRQNRASIKVNPVSSGADEETADVIQGLIRHIEYNSNAEAAYDTAFEAAARSSFGFWRITTDFVGPDSFEQEILLKRVRDHFSVYLDPYHQEPDGSDANWAFVISDMPPEEYKAQYPNSKLASNWVSYEAIGNNKPIWIKSDGCRVVEYFYKVFKNDKLHQLSTGETVLNGKLPERMLAAHTAGVQVQILDSRDVKIPVVKWCKLNGAEILERGEWAGKYIPIVPVYGNELYVDGKRTLESVIRHAKDPQRMLNYWKSAETEAIALAPRAPYIGAEGQFEGHEEEWKNANRRNHPYLEFKQKDLDGAPAGPPQRQVAEPAVQAITQASALAADDLKATTGIYDPALGAGPPDPSGIAISRRQNQAQTATFHFSDNLKRSLKHTGRILIDLIPKVYDTARAARIVKEDGTQQVVQLNHKHNDESGKEVLYDVTVGRYDVVVDTGPSFASKRQEAAASMMQFSQAVPQIASICADIIVRNMDWPGAQELSDRLKKALPPQLQDDPKQQEIPPMVAARMQQMQALLQDLTQRLNETTKIIETKKLDLEHKERVEAWNIQLEREKLQAQIETDLAKLGTQSSIELLKQEVGAIKHENELLNDRLRLLNVNQPIDASPDFNPQEADGGTFAGFGHVGSGPTGGPNAPGTPVGSNP